MTRWRLTTLLVALPLAGCATFGVRSAEVQPGLSATAQASASSSVGRAAGWFFSLDCEADCDTNTLGGDVGVTYGLPNGIAGRPVSIGLGTSTVFPYAEGYVQLVKGRVPFGVGARVGLPVWSWRQHQLAARLDVPLGHGDARLLVDPGVFVHEGRSPNGASSGHVVAFTQALGVLIPGRYVDVAPALTLAAGSARHETRGLPDLGVAGGTTFAAVSVGVTFHRRR